MGPMDLPQLGGGEWKLADHRGEVVLINYWATWCGSCQEELSGLMQVAREAGISLRHAARLFRAHVGTSLGRHYQRRRVLLACNLLVDPVRTVTEVAHELGYADGPHFTRCFRSEKGITPRRYREIYLPFLKAPNH